jgi:hypothetical protein
MSKTYRLIGPDGKEYISDQPGTLGGNSKDRIYGRLDCGSALSAIKRWGDAFRRHQVFFRNAEDAVAAGYRPCGNCLRKEYQQWKIEQEAQSEAGKSAP